MSSLYSIARRFLFSLDPETAHRVIMANLDWAVNLGLTKLVTREPVEDPIEVMGLRFPNVIGLAAGMDKNGECVSAFGGLGFGHVEIGTITPKAQPGNPKPRLFRVIPAEGIINRMGANNHGVDEILGVHLKSAAAFRNRGGILGINIGKNAATPIEKAIDDYLISMRKIYNHTDYIAINISSPNTKNLRSLQAENELEKFLQAITDERQRLIDENYGKRVPFALKVAPDLENDDILHISDQLVDYGIDAIIATNTTIDRDLIQGLPNCNETGGLSGMPLRERSTEVVDLLYRHLQDELPIIASGGVMTGEDAVEKMQAGAKLVQLFTGFIYKGPILVPDCVDAVAKWRETQTGPLASMRP